MHATVWDTVISVRLVDERTELSLVMDSHAHKWLSKILNPLLKGMIQKEVRKDLEAVKLYCERP